MVLTNRVRIASANLDSSPVMQGVGAPCGTVHRGVVQERISVRAEIVPEPTEGLSSSSASNSSLRSRKAHEPYLNSGRFRGNFHWSTRSVAVTRFW